MTERLRARLWIIGALGASWVLFVMVLLALIARDMPLLGVPAGGPMAPLDHGPRVGLGWDIRLWFIAATALWGVLLAFAGALIWSSRGKGRGA